MSHILIACVAVSNTSYAFDKLFSYKIPESLNDGIEMRGRRVIVPFGRGNSHRSGMIFDVKNADSVEDISKLKPLIMICDSKPICDSNLLKLCLWLREYTFCTYYEAVQTVLPSGLHIRIEEKYERGDKEDKNILNENEKNFYAFLEKAKSPAEFDSILRNISPGDKEKKKLVNSLLEKGFIKKISKVTTDVHEKTLKKIRLSRDFIENPDKFKLTPKQKRISDLLLQGDISYSVNEVCYICGVSKNVVDNLEKKGIVEIYEKRIMRDIAEIHETEDIDKLILNDEQQKCFDEISPYLDGKSGAKCFLLHGVTGSGKTSCYKKLIAETLRLGRQAMLLVPEISLTPQIVAAFRAIFGNTVTVVNSSLSLGQRMDAFERIKSGEAKIVIGTRSAVFSPMPDLGLIIMDEEGERSYKSEKSPKYSTIDVAKYRIRQTNAVLLLASATPSLESYYLAKKGVYKLIEMKNRYKGIPLPEVKTVDMSKEKLYGGDLAIGETLVNEINKNLMNYEQTILLLNRRGYNTMLYCSDCCKPVFCSNCSVPMTYHKKNNCLMCHYCGKIEELPKECPTCGGKNLHLSGFGTQKIEESIGKLFPGAKLLRMDADTIFSREEFEKSINDFEKGNYDILIGTQMVGKGLNFPNCTLVGVLSIDKSLYTGDFRSYERTFSLITQVVGRGGRHDKLGRAVLQTYLPQHYIIKYAAAQDYISFYNKEIEIRKKMLYPPFCDICVLLLTGENEEQVANASDELAKFIRNLMKKADPKKIPLRILGPAKCIYERINGKYRRQIILKCKNTKDLRNFIRKVLTEGTKNKKFSNVSVSADINGDIN